MIYSPRWQKKIQHIDSFFFSERKLGLPAANCTELIISPKPKNRLLLHYWYNYKLPALLAQFGAEAFISAAGLASLRTEIPQYLFFENDVFQQETRLNKYYKKIFRAGLAKAKGIFVTEDIFREQAIAQVVEGEEKIVTVNCGTGEKYPEPGFEALQAVKDKYTNGYDFFLFPVTAGSSMHAINILKAFSELKKWQHSSMKLVLLLQGVPEEGLIPDFKNYRYRDDVLFIKDADRHMSEILPAAYAVLYFDKYKTGGNWAKAMQAGIPVIAEDSPVNRGILGDAGMFAGAEAKEIGEKMMRLYKDEYEREKMIAAGRAKAEKYNEETAANEIWSLIAENKAENLLTLQPEN